MASKDPSGEVAKPTGKKKGKTLPLTDFLKPASVGRWADEDVENDTLEGLPTLPTAPGEGPAYQPTAAFTGASSGPSRPLPDHPPFKVFIGNIPYDATESEMADVFTPLQVVDVHIIKHRDTNKPRGCFVEFGTRADLEKGLMKDGAVVLGRPIRVDVAEDRPDRAQRSGGFGGRSDRDFDGGRDRRRGYGFGDGGYEDERRGGSGFEDRRRGGGGGGFADTYGPDRGRPRDGGFGRSGYDDDETRGGRRPMGGPERTERGYGGFSGRHEEETGGDRWGHISREPAQLPVRHTPPVQEAAEPAVHTDRPKITLAPRSEEPAPEQPAPAPVKKSNPFGDAKPIDAEAKIREIEEREKKRRMAEAQKRAAESEAARAAEVRARAAGPGRAINGSPPVREDDSVSSTSAASAERPHGPPGRGGRGDGPGRGGRGRGGGRTALRTGPPPGLEGHSGRGWEGGGRTPRGGHSGRPRSGGSGRGEGDQQGPGPARGPPQRTAAPAAVPEPAKDAAGFQTVNAHQRARNRERDAEAARTAAGPPGLVTKEEPKRAAVSNKFDLLNLDDE
ncbi:g8139 [Coccomyxa elongata]